MGIIKSLFGDSNEIKENNIDWIDLTSLNKIDEVIEKSNSTTVAIFKHSTRCGISRMVKKQFENNFASNKNTIKMYYLDLLNFRELSTEIASKFNVIHESPQLIILRNESVVKDASHHDILEIDLEKYINT